MPVRKQPCTVDGVRYESESAAARDLGIDIMVLRFRLRSSNFLNYTSKHHIKLKRKIASTPCVIKGVEYPSIVEAAKKFKVTPPTISYRLRSVNFPDYVCADIPKVVKPIKYRYTLNGKKYRILQDIADMEGVTKERIRQKINNPKYPGYRRL